MLSFIVFADRGGSIVSLFILFAEDGLQIM